MLVGLTGGHSSQVREWLAARLCAAPAQEETSQHTVSNRKASREQRRERGRDGGRKQQPAASLDQEVGEKGIEAH